MKPTLRPAQDTDSDFVFTVKRAALGDYIDLTWGWDEEFQRNFHVREFDPATIQIISVAGRDVGWLQVEHTEQETHLAGIYVLPEWQGRGIGTSLIEDFVARAGSNGTPVVLQVLKVNPRARALYYRMGFVDDGESPTHHRMRRGE